VEISAQLRLATKALQDEVESLYPFNQSNAQMQLNDYLAMLDLLYPWHLLLENILIEQLPDEAKVKFHFPIISSQIKKELSKYNLLITPSPIAVPKSNNQSFALGCLYVAISSSVSATIMNNLLRRESSSAIIKGDNYYFQVMAEQSYLWPKFVKYLNHVSEQPASHLEFTSKFSLDDAQSGANFLIEQLIAQTLTYNQMKLPTRIAS
jgi:heme oxygenase